MLPGTYPAKQKNGTVYFRASINYRNRHISLGSYQTEEEAYAAYLQAQAILSDSSVNIHNVPCRDQEQGGTAPRPSSNTVPWIPVQYGAPDARSTAPGAALADGRGTPVPRGTPNALPQAVLPHGKAVSLLNFRDNGLYFKNPIYLRKGYFSYFLSPSEELKFDVDDLFYYSSHKIQRRKGHLFVSDYGMQCSILGRYGIHPHAVAGRDYEFANGDALDFRYSNIIIRSHFNGVIQESLGGTVRYRVQIHINGNHTIGTYAAEEKAAIAYNKAADLAKAAGIRKNFPENYVDAFSPKEYAEIYSEIKISKRYRDYLRALGDTARGNHAEKHRSMKRC